MRATIYDPAKVCTNNDRAPSSEATGLNQNSNGAVHGRHGCLESRTRRGCGAATANPGHDEPVLSKRLFRTTRDHIENVPWVASQMSIDQRCQRRQSLTFCTTGSEAPLHMPAPVRSSTARLPDRHVRLIGVLEVPSRHTEGGLDSRVQLDRHAGRPVARLCPCPRRPT